MHIITDALPPAGRKIANQNRNKPATSGQLLTPTSPSLYPSAASHKHSRRRRPNHIRARPLQIHPHSSSSPLPHHYLSRHLDANADVDVGGDGDGVAQGDHRVVRGPYRVGSRLTSRSRRSRKRKSRRRTTRRICGVCGRYSRLCTNCVSICASSKEVSNAEDGLRTAFQR